MLTGKKAPDIYRLSSFRPFSVGAILVFRLSSVQRQVLMRPVVLEYRNDRNNAVGAGLSYSENITL